jgi:calcineurin-like phosphoesterase family protein
MTVYFTSDTHFGDWRPLRIDRRPFKTPPEMDEALIAAWNETVAPGDTVWHLGDFALGPPTAYVASLLERLHGEKHLIAGNNDGPGTLGQAGWRSVQAYAEIDVEGTRLVLCHYAFRTWNGIGRGALNLHGHSHGRLKPQTRQYDVGVDAFPYRPVTLETILASRGRGVSPRPAGPGEGS